MIYQLFIATLLLCFFSSCKKEVPKLPVSEEKITDILTDVHFAEATLQYSTAEQSDSLKNLYYSQIFKIHEISEEKFLESMEILKKHPELTNDIYKKIMEKVDKRKAAFPSKSKDAKNKSELKQDSLFRK